MSGVSGEAWGGGEERERPEGMVERGIEIGGEETEPVEQRSPTPGAHALHAACFRTLEVNWTHS